MWGTHSRVMLSCRNRMQDTNLIANFLVATFRKAQRSEVNLSTIFYLTQKSKILGFPGGTSNKKTNKQTKKNHLLMQEMQETWVWCMGWEDPLEEEMTTHSNVLAWKIRWREESGRLQSTEPQRVAPNWAYIQNAIISTCSYYKKY